MKRISKKYIIFFTLFILLVLTLFFTRFSIKYVRQNLTALLFESGTSLSRTVIEGGTELFKLQRLHEENIKEELIYLSSRIDSLTIETAKQLNLEGYPLVILYNEHGNQEYISPITDIRLSEWNDFSVDIARSLVKSGVDEYVFGIDLDMPGSDVPGGLAVHRDGKILIVFIEKKEAQTHRTGLGYLMRDVAQEPGIEYLVLQNSEGVVIASRGVNKMSGFKNDDLLNDVYDNNESKGRLKSYGNRIVYEVITPFPRMGEFWGVLRIGLNLTEYNAVIRAIMWPIVIIFVLFFILIMVLIYVILLQTRLKRSQIVSEGMTNRAGTIFFEIGCDGNIINKNKEARHLLNILNINENLSIQDIITTEEWDYLKKQKSYTYFGYKLKNRVLNFFTESLSEDSSENNKGFILLADDVTELYDLRKRAEELNHLEGLSELTSTIAHDIRNPLNAISIASQKLDFEIPEEQVKTKNLLSTINLEINNLNTMIEEFLTLSRPISIQRRPHSLVEFIDVLYDSATVIAMPKKISITKVIDIKSEYADIDQSKLSRALGNLIKNAVEASPENEDIEIKVQDVGSNIELSVSNRGKTIPKELQEKLFKPVASTKSKGYGLGLFSAYRIVKNHNGDITVNSVDNLTTFTVIIPH